MMNNQNKLVSLGLAVMIITLIILYSSPSGIDKIKDNIKKLELDNQHKQEQINSSKKILDQNEIEKRILKDSIRLILDKNKKLRVEIKIEKNKYKNIVGKYDKLSNDSISNKINSLVKTNSNKPELIIFREAGEICLEINDSLQIAKSVIIKQDSLLNNDSKIILNQDKLIVKQRSDSTQQNIIINTQQEQISNKSEEIQLIKLQNKKNNAKHIKREIGLGVIAILFLLL